MLKSTLLSAFVAAAFITPALADDKAMTPAADAAAVTSLKRAPVFSERQARIHLARQGYVNISPLARDGNGAWRGTATKAGRNLIVAVTF